MMQHLTPYEDILLENMEDILYRLALCDYNSAYIGYPSDYWNLP